MELPSYEELFGSLDYQDADEYRSVLSPSAYLTNIMDLKNWRYDENDIERTDAVDDRREDISEILLNKENTINEIPHLDVVNGVMEKCLKVKKNNEDPYNTLSSAKFPFNLPFSKAKTEIRHILTYLKSDPARFYTLFKATPDISVKAREMLALSQEEYDTLITPVISEEELLTEHYGVNQGSETVNDLLDLKRFRKSTELSAIQVLELLYHDLSFEERDQGMSSRFFINGQKEGGAYLVTKLVEIPDEDKEEERLYWRTNPKDSDSDISPPPLDCLDRVNRFIRTSRKTGLSFADLDLILMQGCNGELDDNAMQIIAVVKWLRDTYELPIEEICTLFGGIKDYGKGEQAIPGDLFNRKFNNGHSAKINELSDSELSSRLRAGLGSSEYEYDTIAGYLADAGKNITPDPLRLALPYRIKMLSEAFEISVESMFTLFRLIDKNYQLLAKETFPLPLGFKQTIVNTRDIITLEASNDSEPVNNTKNILWLVQLSAILLQWLNDHEMSVEQLEFICTENSEGEIEDIPNSQEITDLFRDLAEQFKTELFSPQRIVSSVTDQRTALALFERLSNIETGAMTRRGLVTRLTTAEELLPVYQAAIREKLLITAEDLSKTNLTGTEMANLILLARNEGFIDLDGYVSSKDTHRDFLSDPLNIETFLEGTDRTVAAIVFNELSTRAKNYDLARNAAPSECAAIAESIRVQADLQQSVLLGALETTLNQTSDILRILLVTFFTTIDETEQMATVRFMTPIMEAVDKEALSGELKFNASLVTSFRRLLQFNLLAAKTDLRARELEVLFSIKEVQDSLPEKLKWPASFIDSVNAMDSIDAMYIDVEGGIYIFNGDQYVYFSGRNYAFESSGKTRELMKDIVPDEFLTPDGSGAIISAAVTVAEQQTYLFSKTQFANVGTPEKPPANTAEHWGKVRNNIVEQNRVDAAYVSSDGKLFLFSGDQYVRYSGPARDYVDEGYPKRTLEHWNSEKQVPLPIEIREQINSIFLDSDDKVYFFSSDKFIDSSEPFLVKRTQDRWGQVINNIVDNNHIDAVLIKGDVTYIFSGDQYIRYSGADYTHVDEGYPRKIANNWNNETILTLSDDYLLKIDAAFTGIDGHAYLFNGNTFVSSDAADKSEAVNKKWGKVLNNIELNNVVDAVLVKDGVTYLFSGDQYFKYSGADYSFVDEGYPKKIARWNNSEEQGVLPDTFINAGLSAAIAGRDQTVWYFSGNEYIGSYTNAQPAQIKDAWAKVRNNIQDNNRIDAGFVSPEGVTYLFSGDQYYRYSSADYSKVDEGYPRKISGYWGGLPASFNNKVDAAFVFNVDGIDRLYLFSGEYYVRYSTSDYSKVDRDYPRRLGDKYHKEGKWFDKIDDFDFDEDDRDGKYDRSIITAFTDEYKGRPRINLFYKYKDKERFIQYQYEGKKDISPDKEYKYYKWSKYVYVSELTLAPFNTIDVGFSGADGTVYLFSGSKFAAMKGDYAGIEAPAPVNSQWGFVINLFEDLNRIDAGFTAPNGMVYLFCDTQYIRYSGNLRPGEANFYVDEAYPKTISTKWPDENIPVMLPDKFSAKANALFTASDGTVYVFVGNQFTSSADPTAAAINTFWGKVENNFMSLNKVDAAFIKDGVSYLFAGDQYTRYSGDYSAYADEAYPKKIANIKNADGIELPAKFSDGIDAAMHGADGNLYIFAEGQFVSLADAAEVFKINSKFGKVRNEIVATGIIDAADVNPDGVLYLFSADQYVRYSAGRRDFVDESYPKTLANWNDHEAVEFPAIVSQGVQAHFTDVDGQGYFFIDQDFFSADDPAIRATINTKWGIVKNNIRETGLVDAAFVTPGGKLVLFSGNQYAQYSLDSTKRIARGYPDENGEIAYLEEGFPKEIADHWGDLPTEYREGPDAAAVFDGRIYFFKGDTYIRYSDLAGKRIDTDFPRKIADQMSELPEFRLNDVKTSQQFKELSKAYSFPDNSILQYFTDSKDKNHLDKSAQVARLSSITGWQRDQIDGLASDSDVISVQDVNNDIDTEIDLLSDIPALSRMKNIFDVADSMASRPLTLKEQAWDKIHETSALQEAATFLSNQLQSVVGEAAWKDLSSDLHNIMNRAKRDALLGYLIYEMQDALIENPRDLYEYLLIDVEMGEEAVTSRIQEAIMCMQLFYHRMLVNLEEYDSTDEGKDVKRKLKKWWLWMKNYRVWEANRKVFLYPENYIRPELRPDKSPEFKELEEALLQGDITAETAETAYKTYLDKFGEVSKLRVTGGYFYQVVDGADDGNQTNEKRIITFGHTNTEPKKYYYMTGDIRERFDERSDRSEDKIQNIDWAPWKEVGININADKVYPVFAFNRLFVFWVEVRERDESEYSNSVGPDQKKIHYDPILFYSFFNSKEEWVHPQEMYSLKNLLDDPDTEGREIFIDDKKSKKERPDDYIDTLEALNSARLYVTNPITSRYYDEEEYIYVSYEARYTTKSNTSYVFKLEGKLKSDLGFEEATELSNILDRLEKNIEFPIEKFGIRTEKSDLYYHWKGFNNDSFTAPWYSFSDKGGSFLVKPYFIADAPERIELTEEDQNPDGKLELELNTIRTDGTNEKKTVLLENLPDAGFIDNESRKHLFYSENLDPNSPTSQQYIVVGEGGVSAPIRVDSVWGKGNVFAWYADEITSVVVNGEKLFMATSGSRYLSYSGPPFDFIEQNQSTVNNPDSQQDFTLAQLLPTERAINWDNIILDFNTYIASVKDALVWEEGFYLLMQKNDGSFEYTSPTVQAFWQAVAENISSVGSYSTIDSAAVLTEGDNSSLIVTNGINVVMYDFATAKWTLSSISDKWGVDFDHIDAIVQTADGAIYLFSGREFAEKVSDVYTTAPLETKWGFVSNNIIEGNKVDAAVRASNGKVYFFSGDQYFRYSDINSKVIDQGYPKNILGSVSEDIIKEEFSGDTTNITKVTINNISPQAAFVRNLPGLNNSEKLYLFFDVDATVDLYIWRFKWQWLGSWFTTPQGQRYRLPWGRWVKRYYQVKIEGQRQRKSFYARFSENGDEYNIDEDYPKLVAGNWTNLPGDFNKTITATFEDVERDGDSQKKIFYAIRSLKEASEVTNDYVKYTGEQNFPKEIVEEPYEIIRLTSNTSEVFSQKLFFDGIEGLLSLENQRAASGEPALELPQFEGLPDNVRLNIEEVIVRDVIRELILKLINSNSTSDAEYIAPNNSIIRYKSTYIQKAPSGRDLDFDSPNGQYYWEIFFHAPFLIAQTFNNAQKFEDATRWYEYIFDPTEDNDDSAKAFWKFFPFHTDIEAGQSNEVTNPVQYCRYLNDPFNPHAIAGLRQLAYRKAIVMAYIDNLIDHGDLLFRQYTRETINEARMLYVLAYDLLGKKPELTGTRRPSDAQTYKELRARVYGLNMEKIDMGLVELENLPCNVQLPAPGQDVNPNGSLLDPYGYFYIPENREFSAYWDRVEDRLFKIRQSLNIDGIKQRLPLFEPPLDVMALVRAVGSGMGLAQALADYNVAIPHYRFNFILAKARELNARVIQFGQSLLSALEKGDAEELALLRNSHEKAILQLTLDIKEAQLEDSKETLGSLQANLRGAKIREAHYTSLLNQGLSGFEKSQLSLMATAQLFTNLSQSMSIAGAFGGNLPEVGAFAFHWGGHNLHNLFLGLNESFNALSNNFSYRANLSSILGGYHRRSQDWGLQQRLAGADIESIERQIAGAEIKIKIARLDIQTTKKNIENLESVDTFMKNKFTNLQLYRWMSGKLSGLYFQTYQMALDMAKMAQKAFQFELGAKESEINYIGSFYWDSLKKGLLAGESLQVDLNRLEKAYIEKNQRCFEISKTVSLQQLDPLALLNLRQNRVCEFTLSEELFDYDFPGHYRRQIKSVSITFPAVAGVYETVNATLTQLSHRTLIEPDQEGVEYLLAPQAGIDQPLSVRADWRTNQQIALSRGVNDAGLFQLNFQDERYLPFEGTGAVSTWRLELNGQENAFDIRTLTDVLIKIEYMALQGGDIFAAQVKKKLKSSPAAKVFNLSEDFSAEWNRFMENPAAGLSFKLTREMFPNLGSNKVSGLYMLFSLSKEGGKKIGDTAMNLVRRSNDNILIKQATLVDLKESNRELTISSSGSEWKLQPQSSPELFTPEHISNIALVCLYEKKPNF